LSAASAILLRRMLLMMLIMLGTPSYYVCGWCSAVCHKGKCLHAKTTVPNDCVR
jgi:hypothetical protein